MGMINPALSKVGPEPVSLTFVTGTYPDREICRNLEDKHEHEHHLLT